MKSGTDDLFNSVTAHSVEMRRIFISRYFYAKFGGKVQRGPLKGFALDDNPAWGPGDLAPKLFGLYEQEVLAIIERQKGARRTLVNLGAADGYYGVGLVATRHFQNAVCYELSAEGRAAIKRTAELNEISDRVQIMAEATNNFPNELDKLGIAIKESLILCDVEGAEFGIFNEECLARLRGTEVIIELHDFMVPNGDQALQQLVKWAGRYFKLNMIRTGPRDLSGVPELDNVPDDDRWLICSEGRPKSMQWLHLSPN